MTTFANRYRLLVLRLKTGEAFYMALIAGVLLIKAGMYAAIYLLDPVAVNGALKDAGIGRDTFAIITIETFMLAVAFGLAAVARRQHNGHWYSPRKG